MSSLSYPGAWVEKYDSDAARAARELRQTPLPPLHAASAAGDLKSIDVRYQMRAVSGGFNV